MPPVQPDPGGGVADKATGDWWAIKIPILRTGRAIITYVRGTRQQVLNIDPGATIVGGPYATEKIAEQKVPQGSHGTTKSHSGNPVIDARPGNPLGWLSGIGGGLASGIEGGVVAVLTDIWKVISGPVLVIAGVIIAVIVLVVYFKNDITQAGASLGALAGMGAV